MDHDPRDSWLVPGLTSSRGVIKQIVDGSTLDRWLPRAVPWSHFLNVRFQWLSNRWLVTGYIAVIGLLLSIGVVTQLLLAVQVGEMTVVGPLSGMLPVLLFLSIGYWLTRSELDNENVLSVAKWGGLAIAILTLVNSAVIFVHRSMTPVLTPGLTMLVSNIAIGGIIGLVFGWMRQLDRKARTRYRKSTVLNRTLRHDLRNDVNVILGYLEVLERDLPEKHLDRIELVRERVSHLQSIGENARHLQAAVEESSDPGQSVEAAGLLRDTLERVNRTHPDVELDAELPTTAWVAADDHLPIVFEHLLDNAIEHNHDPKRVGVSVSVTDRDRVELAVSDNGPGIPEPELAVLRDGHETPLEHSSGIGLWLVKWLVTSYGGSVSISTGDGGTTIQLELPRAQPDVGAQLTSYWRDTISTPD